MRLWLDPAKMAGYGVTPSDIKDALDRENVELPSGSIEGNTTELTIRTLGLMHTSQEFNDLVIREDGDRIIRLSDVGRAELGPQDTRSYMKMNGIPMVGRGGRPAAGRQPHRDRRRRLRTHGDDEEGSARRRGHLLRFRQHALHPRLDRRGEADRLRGLRAGDHHHLPLPAELARDAHPLHRDPRLADRYVLHHVRGRLLDQRPLDAGRRAVGRSGRRRRHRDDRKHLHPHRTRHVAPATPASKGPRRSSSPSSRPPSR